MKKTYIQEMQNIQISIAAQRKENPSFGTMPSNGSCKETVEESVFNPHANSDQESDVAYLADQSKEANCYSDGVHYALAAVSTIETQQSVYYCIDDMHDNVQAIQAMITGPSCIH